MPIENDLESSSSQVTITLPGQTGLCRTLEVRDAVVAAATRRQGQSAYNAPLAAKRGPIFADAEHRGGKGRVQ